MKNKNVPRSSLARTAVATATAVKAGSKTVRFLVEKPFQKGEHRDQHKTDFDRELGEVIFAGLSKLRGTALKLAQMLSLEMSFLPPELQRKLNQSHYQVPPLNKVVVRRVIETEFGKPLEELFPRFELDAFAAASLGQVHRATLPDGRSVAVKVQYPGIKETIASDLKLVKSIIVPLIRHKVSKEYLDSVIAELWEKLNDETDYLLEAKRGAYFNDTVRHPDIVIPKPIVEFSGRTVLTAEMIDGWHLNEFLAKNPAQETINKACQAIFDFHVETLFLDNRLHCDPNPGNYLFLADGKVAVIDFGCVKEYSDDSMRKIAPVMRAAARGEKEAVFHYMSTLGYDPTDEKSRTMFDDYLYPFIETFRQVYDHPTFDFKQHPSFSEDCSAALVKALNAGKVLGGFTPETIHIDRNFFGIYRIFQILGAEIRSDHRLLFQEECA